MKSDCVIGVDIGTQGTRAALYATDGALLAEADEPSLLHRPGPGLVEEDAERQFASVCRTIRSCLEKAKVAKDQVAALAIDGQMAGVIGVGKDGRAVDALRLLARHPLRPLHRADEAARRRAPCSPAPATSPSFNHGPKILWWKRRAPRASTPGSPPSCSRAAMPRCGSAGSPAARPSSTTPTSISPASPTTQSAPGTGSSAPSSACRTDKLPRIASPTEVVGTLDGPAASATGLLAGTTWRPACGDTAASFLACGAVEPGICVDVAGTASVFAATVPGFAADLPRGSWAAAARPSPGLWHPYAYINGGGLNLNWFVEQFASTDAGASPAAAKDRLEKAVAGLDARIAGMKRRLDDPYFIPHMEGRVMPSTPHMRGAFFGLTRDHDLARLYRSLLEGVALEYALYRDAVKQLHPGLTLTELRVTGGGAKDTAWNAIKAEVLDLPLLAVERGGGAPMGAALVAAAAASAIQDLAAAARSWVHLGRAVLPTGEGNGLYRARTRRYAELLKALAGLSQAPSKRFKAPDRGEEFVNVTELTPARKPSFYFVGVTTGKSSIMRVFPRWAEYLSSGMSRSAGSTASGTTTRRSTGRWWPS